MEEEEEESILRENRKLLKELAQCKADKDFVWSLWKQLQRDSPDKTALVNTVITRERQKGEQRDQELLATIEAKETEIAHLNDALVSREADMREFHLRVKSAESEVCLLESRLEGQCIEAEKQAKLVERLLVECEGLKERCNSAEDSNQRLLEDREALLLQVSDDRRVALEKEQLQRELLEREQEIKDLQTAVGDFKTRISALTSECSAGAERYNNLEQQLEREKQRAREISDNKDTEIKQLGEKLKEMGSARDAWAGHTTLQASTIQKLQEENKRLKEEVALGVEQQKKTDSKPALSPAHVSTGETEPFICDHCNDISKLQKLLELTEKDLFGAKAQLEAKGDEVRQTRTAHSRRLQRMRGLQTSHKLLLEQLNTYESSEPLQPPKKKASVKALRHENSDAVWNELSLSRHKCEKLEQQLLEVEEERDALQVKCAQNQTTNTELRQCLQYEKDDLEQKIAAIAECDSVISLSSQENLQKVAQLEGLVSQLLEEKRNFEETCYHLREDASRMQSSIVLLKHKLKQRRLLTLSKSTMTDPPSGGGDSGSLTMTDSSTQVDLISPRQPELRDAQVSPINSPHLSDPSTPPAPTPTHPHTRLSSSRAPSHSLHFPHCCCCHHQHHSYHHRCQHSRAYSDGHVLYCKKTTQQREQSSSRSLGLKRPVDKPSLSGPFLTLDQKTDITGVAVPTLSRALAVAGVGTTESGSFSKKQKCSRISPGGRVRDGIGTQSPDKSSVVVVNTSSKVRPLSAVVTGPHKCVWQQQAKSLQQRLRTLAKQVRSLRNSKQCLSVALEEDKAACTRAKSEARDLSQRVQLQKTSLQALQDEVQRLKEGKEELEGKCAALELEHHKGRTEADWKRLESEKKGMSERYSSMKDTEKSLRDQLDSRTKELSTSRDRCSRAERDSRQLKMLMEDQRKKLKEAKEEAAIDRAKVQNLAAEILTLNETTAQHRHKVDLLRSQLSRNTSDQKKLMDMLRKCQEELAHTLQQLSACEENCRRKEMTVSQAKQSFQRRTEELQKQCEVKGHQLEGQLRARDKQLQEFQSFTKDLACALEEQYQSRQQQAHLRRKQLQRHQDRERDSNAMSSRAREIARTALQLSDVEIEDLFSDGETHSGALDPQQQESFTDCVTRVLSKPSFATNLTKCFIDFLSQIIGVD